MITKKMMIHKTLMMRMKKIKRKIFNSCYYLGKVVKSVSKKMMKIKEIQMKKEKRKCKNCYQIN